MRLVCLLAAFTLASFTGSPALACSTFCLGEPEARVFGKNYDWHVDAGILVVNKRGVTKEAVTAPEDTPARWTSAYGSVTFNQYGREFPSGGMNEAGLVIELMWLEDTEYPAPDERPALGSLQWIQYQLDRNATVADVIASDADVRISARTAGRIHYLVADRTGATATIEFLDGALVATVDAAVLTNHTYAAGTAFASRVHAGQVSDVGRGSLERFARLARATRAPGGDDAVARAFALLGDVAQGDFTKWSIVYEIDTGVIHFTTHQAPQRKHLALADVSFDCNTAVDVIDLNDAVAGDLRTHMAPFTVEQNLTTLTRGFREVDFLRHVSDEALEQMARYPASMPCASPQSMD